MTGHPTTATLTGHQTGQGGGTDPAPTTQTRLTGHTGQTCQCRWCTETTPADLTALTTLAVDAPLPHPAEVIDDFRVNLRRLREAHHLKGRDVAAILGFRPATYASWERGDRALPTKVLPALAAVYGLNPADLFDRQTVVVRSRQALLAALAATWTAGPTE